MKEMSDYKKAKKRVKKRKGFYSHLFTYVAVNIWIFFMSGFHINFGMAFWWGFGLFFHYVSVFGMPGTGKLSKEWEEREIEKEMSRMSDEKKMLPPTNRSAVEMPERQKRWSEEDLV